jgi:hypothetical protein
MKRRKTLFLSEDAISRAEQVAAETGKTISSVIEERLLGLPLSHPLKEDFWPAPPLRPVKRPGDPRQRYLKRKHG